MMQNSNLKRLSLVDLNIGESIESREMLSDMILYNETLIKLNISGNKLIKIKPLIQNLARNCLSNIQKLVLS
jgi:hypothetical protein